MRLEDRSGRLVAVAARHAEEETAMLEVVGVQQTPSSERRAPPTRGFDGASGRRAGCRSCFWVYRDSRRFFGPNRDLFFRQEELRLHLHLSSLSPTVEKAVCPRSYRLSVLSYPLQALSEAARMPLSFPYRAKTRQCR